jgi:hypothetical protein
VHVVLALAVVAGCRPLPPSGYPPAHWQDAGVVDASSIDAATFDVPRTDALVSEDGGLCWPRTSLAEFDAFANAFVAAYVARGEWPGEAYRPLGRVRPRIVSGALVLDTSLRDACLAWIPGSDGFQAWTQPGTPCARIFFPRCARPPGSPCLDLFDCDVELRCLPDGCAGEAWCDTIDFRFASSCDFPGTCVPRSPIGGPCAFDHDEQCSDPDPGFDVTTCNVGADGEMRCLNASYRVNEENCADPTRQPDGSLILPTCPAGMICASVLSGFRCYRPVPDSPMGTECFHDSECADGLMCIGRECRPGACVYCTLNGGFVCGGDTCVATTGMRGARCDVGDPDCLPGFACRDGTCGDRAPNDEPCGTDADCETGCCRSLGSPDVCTPLP